MILAAWSEGVGSNWVGFRGLEEVKSLLSIPDELEVLAIIPFGYPAAHRQGRQKAQVDLRSRPSRAIRAALWMKLVPKDPFSPLRD
jgi:nitroreductase